MNRKKRPAPRVPAPNSEAESEIMLGLRPRRVALISYALWEIREDVGDNGPNVYCLAHSSGDVGGVVDDAEECLMTMSLLPEGNEKLPARVRRARIALVARRVVLAHERARARAVHAQWKALADQARARYEFL